MTSQQAMETLAGVALLLGLASVIQRRVLTCVGFYAAQSLLLAAVTVIAGASHRSTELYVVAAATAAIKVVLIPIVLGRIIDRLKIRRDIEPFLGVPLAAALAVGLVIAAFYVGGRLRDAVGVAHDFLLPCSIAMMLLGLLMMIARVKAITQIVGLLFMENGIYLVALGLVENVPLMLELGVTFDVLVAVIVMGAFVYRISRTFESIDVDDLTFLKG